MTACLVYVMAFFYMMAGLNHFLNTSFYMKMILNFLPYPKFIVYLSGLIEIILGIGLIFFETRRISALGIILLLIVIFPANINMALHAKKWKFSPLLLYLRLPLQFFLIYWAWIYT